MSEGLRGPRLRSQRRLALQMSCEGSGRAAELAAQHVRLALQHPGPAERSRIFQAPARYQKTACRARIRAKTRQNLTEVVACPGTRGQARPAGHARLPHEHDLSLFRTSCCPPRAGTRRTISTPATCTFIHLLSAAVDPVWQARSDWEIYKGFAKAFPRSASAIWASRRRSLTPLLHDTPTELAQAIGVQDWKAASDDPGKTAPKSRWSSVTTRTPYKRFTALGPLMNKLGNGGGASPGRPSSRSRSSASSTA